MTRWLCAAGAGSMSRGSSTGYVARLTLNLEEYSFRPTMTVNIDGRGDSDVICSDATTIAGMNIQAVHRVIHASTHTSRPSAKTRRTRGAEGRRHPVESLNASACTSHGSTSR
jgi:hypothetical protein